MAEEKITQLEISIVKIESKIDNIEAAVGDIKTTLTTYIEKAENKYAAKWVEKAIIWVTTLSLGALFLAIIKGVIK